MTAILPDAPWRARPGAAELLEALGAAEGLTRFVGGCVRDTLLGLDVADVDLATRLLPDEVTARLRKAGLKAVPTGIAHGTVTAVSSGDPYEVTTLRRDVETDGRHAEVAFTDDWREDAARRDFTINALSADPITGELFDYFGGADDLAARHVRFIGDPLTRIAEDRLRILRFFRFHARFGVGAPDADGLAACIARANDLMALSRERIAGELLRLLGLPAPQDTVALMVETGILRPVLPEIIGAERLPVLIRREAEAGIAPDPVRRLAALLPSDPALAEQIAARLKLSKRQGKQLASAVTAEVGPPHPLAYRIGSAEAVDRLLLGDGPVGDLAALQAWAKPRLPIGGGDLIAAGVAPGPDVSRMLRRIEDRWIEEGFPGKDRVTAILNEEVGAGV